MIDRIQINVPTYMLLDGQPQIVYPGTVCDVSRAADYAGASTVLSPSEPAGTLASHGKPTPVRSVRTR